MRYHEEQHLQVVKAEMKASEWISKHGELQKRHGELQKLCMAAVPVIGVGCGLFAES